MKRSRSVETTLTEDVNASERILRTIAGVEGMDPIELTPPLYSVVDPEALDAFVESLGERSGWIEFDYRGYQVTVDGAGGVSVHLVDADETSGP
ncbi:HalOD1 output domain-containing protein [Halalkalicoccus ordinarius]|uniref:HalOD1 output domain-containing protein n=1 Tax=Halalkalicoccus ordinarius TaxID=3116651 RepID=UPI00300E7DA8